MSQAARRCELLPIAAFAGISLNAQDVFPFFAHVLPIGNN
jgi:hypothetical protein